MLWARAMGRCEICGKSLSWEAYSKHHRRPRGMGGNREGWVNDVTNLLLLCGTGVSGCHGMVEANRARAYDAGWLVRSGYRPVEVPVDITGIGMHFLTPAGAYEPAARLA